jgi:hypothetical protein
MKSRRWEETEMGTKLRLVVVTGVALAVGVASFASAADNKTDGRKKVTINLTAKTFQEAELDLGATGFTLGDRFVFSDDLFQNGRNVGLVGVECTAVRILPQPLPADQEPQSVTFNCVGAFDLRQGQVTLQGLLTFNQQTEEGAPITAAVTGGTGRFRTAHGQIRVINTSETESRIKLKLIL